MINATLYKFKKRVNSTKIPTGGESVSVALKEQCSVYTPVLLLNSNFAIISEYNYAKFLDNYYYITDIISISNSHVEIHCQLDAMATYKNDILATTAYVLYSTSGTTEIADGRLLTNINIYTSETKAEISAFKYSPKGAFVLNVIGDRGNPLTGFTTSYLLAPTEIENVADQLLQPSVAEQLKQFFASPFDAIISCTWTPYGIASGKINTVETPITIGNYNTGLIGHLITSVVLTDSVDLAIPELTEQNYLDVPPYTTATLYLPFVGVVEIDTSLLYKKDKLTIDYAIDLYNADIAYLIKSNDNIISTCSGRCGSVLPVASSGVDLMRFVTGVSLAIGGMAIGGGLGLAIGATTAGLLADRTVTQVNGGYSGRAGTIDMDIKLKYTHHDISDKPNAINSALGLPYGKTVTLGSLSGYVQCSNASVQAETSNDYLAQINDYLNGGAYIE